jgi:hypothetical protein
MLEFDLGVNLDIVRLETARDLVEISGTHVGLGDFRPARRGRYGKHVLASWEVQE